MQGGVESRDEWQEAEGCEKRRRQGFGDGGGLTGDCVAAELSLLVASNSSLIKSLNPPHFKAPVLYN